MRVFMISFCMAMMSILSVGCAWESTAGSDGGVEQDGQVQTDEQGGDENLEYPPPPYGPDYGDTAPDFQVEECFCDGAEPVGQAFALSDMLGSKAIMITVHAGWCTYCKTQTSTMESGVYRPYKDQGLDIMLVLFQDENGSSARDNLLAYCCETRERYGLSFHVAIDPDAEATDQFFRPTEAGTPLNMLLDDEMEIRYKVEGLIPDSRILEGTIEGILGE